MPGERFARAAAVLRSTAGKIASRPTRRRAMPDRNASSPDVDWLVIGSGFGGSVAALRLAEKGYDVQVLEQGRRFRDDDFAKSAWQAHRLLWAPRAGLKGIMALTPFRHVSVLSGVGVGGGSLVYGNTL